MITDFQCNTVCFSALLQGLAPVTYANMISVLDRYGIGYRLLPHTNDVWCRDYMPVQVLMIPAFGCPEDEQAFDQIVSFMPMYKDRIEMVPATDLVRHEGCLNCASWTVRV